jgi:acetolactate synthase I/II/III large subunit
MNGADSLLQTLRANGVTTVFANPGTSEMHFVDAMDRTAEMNGVLCLFEGVATGAADGFARVKKTPAATLLHLGPGLANGWANLHNARRARVPVLNIVGDHATYHAPLDAPLQSNISSLASALQGWYRTSESPNEVGRDAYEALRAAMGPPAVVSTLILPADTSWGDVTEPQQPLIVTPSLAATPDVTTLAEALDALRNKRCALFVGGDATEKEYLALAKQLADATGAKLLMETFPAIMDRGSGVVNPERLIYVSEFAQAQLADVEALVLLGASEPVGFFAYPNVASRLAPEGCQIIELAPPGVSAWEALGALCEELSVGPLVHETGVVPGRPTGEITPQSFADAVGATMTEGLIVADESNTSGTQLFGATRFAPPHQWMTLTGGSIGYGLPVALGAAMASKQRVLALESDGSMMYTLQALWTMAREQLDVTVVCLSNRSYAILNFERSRVGVSVDGSTSQRMLELDNPPIDFCSLARAQGVPSVKVTTAEALTTEIERSYATPGPYFIEVEFAKRGF